MTSYFVSYLDQIIISGIELLSARRNIFKYSSLCINGYNTLPYFYLINYISSYLCYRHI